MSTVPAISSIRAPLTRATAVSSICSAVIVVSAGRSSVKSVCTVPPTFLGRSPTLLISASRGWSSSASASAAGPSASTVTDRWGDSAWKSLSEAVPRDAAIPSMRPSFMVRSRDSPVKRPLPPTPSTAGIGRR